MVMSFMRVIFLAFCPGRPVSVDLGAGRRIDCQLFEQRVDDGRLAREAPVLAVFVFWGADSDPLTRSKSAGLPAALGPCT